MIDRQEKLVIDPEATKRRLEAAKKAGDSGDDVLQLDRVLELERQILGARAQYSSIVPPMFFVRRYALAADGEFDWCEPFFIPEVFDPRTIRTVGKVIAPPGRAEEAAREPCPHCGESAFVVGEYYHDIQPLSLTSFTVRLFLYCRRCPRVVHLAELERQTFDLKRRLRGCK